MNDLEILRPRYLDDQVLRPDDLRLEQAYHLSMHRRHNVTHHTPGILVGLALEKDSADPTRVLVRRGVAVDAYGRDLILTEDRAITAADFELRRTNRLSAWLVYDLRAIPEPLVNGNGAASNGIASFSEKSMQSLASRLLAEVGTNLNDPSRLVELTRALKGLEVVATSRAQLHRAFEQPSASSTPARFEESPRVLLTVPGEDPPHPTFDGLTTPPDDPAVSAPVFLGMIDRDVDGKLDLLLADRVFAGVRAECLEAASGLGAIRFAGAMTSEQLAEGAEFAIETRTLGDREDPSRWLSVHRRSKEKPRREVEIVGETQIRDGDLVVHQGAVEFVAGVVKDAGPTNDNAGSARMYLREVTAKLQDREPPNVGPRTELITLEIANDLIGQLRGRLEDDDQGSFDTQQSVIRTEYIKELRTSLRDIVRSHAAQPPTELASLIKSKFSSILEDDVRQTIAEEVRPLLAPDDFADQVKQGIKEVKEASPNFEARLIDTLECLKALDHDSNVEPLRNSAGAAGANASETGTSQAMRQLCVEIPNDAAANRLSSVMIGTVDAEGTKVQAVMTIEHDKVTVHGDLVVLGKAQFLRGIKPDELSPETAAITASLIASTRLRPGAKGVKEQLDTIEQFLATPEGRAQVLDALLRSDDSMTQIATKILQDLARLPARLKQFLDEMLRRNQGTELGKQLAESLKTPGNEDESDELIKALLDADSQRLLNDLAQVLKANPDLLTKLLDQLLKLKTGSLLGEKLAEALKVPGNVTEFPPFLIALLEADHRKLLATLPAILKENNHLVVIADGLVEDGKLNALTETLLGADSTKRAKALGKSLLEQPILLTNLIVALVQETATNPNLNTLLDHLVFDSQPADDAAKTIDSAVINSFTDKEFALFIKLLKRLLAKPGEIPFPKELVLREDLVKTVIAHAQETLPGNSQQTLLKNLVSKSLKDNRLDNLVGSLCEPTDAETLECPLMDAFLKSLAENRPALPESNPLHQSMLKFVNSLITVETENHSTAVEKFVEALGKNEKPKPVGIPFKKSDGDEIAFDSPAKPSDVSSPGWFAFLKNGHASNLGGSTTNLARLKAELEGTNPDPNDNNAKKLRHKPLKDKLTVSST